MTDMLQKHTSKNPIIIAAIVAAIGGWGTALITNWDKIFGAAKDVAPYEDLASLHQVSDVLHQNQAANALYADFLEDADEHTSFSDHFRMWQDLADTKQRLLDRTQELKPTPRFARLHEILSESLQSDVKLMELEESSLRHTLDGIEAMQSLVDEPQPDYSNLSEDERREIAWEMLNKLRIQNKIWLDKAREIEASLQSTRAISSTAVQMLNDEVKRLTLPYNHENPYAERREASDSD